MSANQLIEMLHLDKSYISRLIRNFEQKGIITRYTSSDDRRALIIQLISKGQAEVNRLIAITNEKIDELIEPLDSETCEHLCEAMGTIINIFHNNTNWQEERHLYGKYGFQITETKPNYEWASYKLIEEKWEYHNGDARA